MVEVGNRVAADLVPHDHDFTGSFRRHGGVVDIRYQEPLDAFPQTIKTVGRMCRVLGNIPIKDERAAYSYP